MVLRAPEKWSFWGAGEVLFLALGVDYVDMFTLWLFIKLYIYDWCTFLCVYFFFKKQ